MRARLLASTAALILLVTAVAGPPAQADLARSGPGLPPGPAEQAAGPSEHSVERIVARMSLPEKVGQLFSTYVYGNDATEPAAADAAVNQRQYGVPTPAQVVAKYHLGGVIYFSWSHNLSSPRQIAELSNGLQTAATGTGTGVPLLVSTDQEQGVVLRMPAPAAQFPGSMALGAGRQVTDAYTAAEITGRELRAVGIQQPFAPVADVNINPANPVIGVRSFGSNPELVADMTAAQVTGFQNGADASATVKHFPGHGDTATDSHTGLPVISHTRDEWYQLDAPPFQAAIAAGVDSIMTAHIVVPALDSSGDPATLSPTILTGLLREQLAFTGVVVTDSLSMAAVRQRYGDARVPVLALKAGADMLLMPPNLELAYQSVLAAVADGELTEERIDQSVRRILALKQRRGVLAQPMVEVDAAGQLVGRAEHQRAVQRITDSTVTVVRNDAGLLPLSGPGRSVLVTGWNTSSFHNVSTLAERLAERGNQTTALVTGLPGDAKIAEAVAAARTHDLTVVLTQKAWDTQVTDPRGTQRKLVHALAATGRPIIVIAVRDPYDLGHFPDVATQLVTYTYTPAAMESVARVLSGELSPVGRLPVSIPDPTDPTNPRYPYGHGLTW